MYFKSYKPDKYSSDKGYINSLNNGFFSENTQLKFRRLCKICGYPYGIHVGIADICPDGILTNGIEPEFLKDITKLKIL